MTRRPSHGAAAGGSIAALVGIMTCASMAAATSSADTKIAVLSRASDLVVVGRVERVDVLPHGPAGQPGIHSRAEVRVSDILRGATGPTVQVWVQGGRLGTRMRVVPGQARFRQGDEALLFLFRAGGGYWPTGMARGMWQRSSAGDPWHGPDGLEASDAVLRAGVREVSP